METIIIIILLVIIGILLSQNKEQKSSIEFRKPDQGKRNKSFEPGELVTTNVVGVTFDGRQKFIKDLKVNQMVFLEREKENFYDENAINVKVYKYSKEERERLEKERNNNYDEKKKELSEEYHKAFWEKWHLENNKEREKNEIKIEEKDRELKTISKEQSELSSNYWKISEREELERLQIGYLNRELVKKIAPIFDEYALTPCNIIEGKIIEITGKNDSTLTKGVVIRFNLPNERTQNEALKWSMIN